MGGREPESSSENSLDPLVWTKAGEFAIQASDLCELLSLNQRPRTSARWVWRKQNLSSTIQLLGELASKDQDLWRVFEDPLVPLLPWVPKSHTPPGHSYLASQNGFHGLAFLLVRLQQTLKDKQVQDSPTESLFPRWEPRR